MKTSTQKEIEFKSTRNDSLRLSFWPSVVQGMAADGGLLVPTFFPELSGNTITNKKWWVSSKPADFAYEVARLFVPESEISSAELSKGIQNAINFAFPLESLGDNNFVLRIDQGPTASFKDVAARTLSFLMSSYAVKHDKKINIVVATSGDTGVAIADAFGNAKNITVTVLYPSAGVSEIQEKQMLEVHHKYENEQVIPVKGNFDNCQDIAKFLQAAREIKKEDTAAKEKFIEECKVKLGISVKISEVDSLIEIVSGLDLSSANSINIWRLVPQMTQYFTAYGSLVKSGKVKAGEEIVFSVPTGNVGHLMAGIYAKELGLPVKRFIIGTNTNNILANVIGSGVVRHRPFTQSSAPSMDILDPSNLERLLHFAAYKTGYVGAINYVAMKRDIKKMQSEHESVSLLAYGVTQDMLSYLQNLIWAEDVETDEEIYAMMRQVYAQKSIVLEPHGVTGLIAVIRARAKAVVDIKTKVVIFETAHPDKFNTSLVASGLEKAKRNKHPVLERLKKMDIKKLGKPKAESLGVLAIARKIKKLSN